MQTENDKRIYEVFNKIQTLHSIQQDYLNMLGQLILESQKEKEKEQQ